MIFEEFLNKKAHAENNSSSNNTLNQPIKKSCREFKYLREYVVALHFAVLLTLALTLRSGSEIIVSEARFVCVLRPLLDPQN